MSYSGAGDLRPYRPKQPKPIGPANQSINGMGSNTLPPPPKARIKWQCSYCLSTHEGITSCTNCGAPLASRVPEPSLTWDTLGDYITAEVDHIRRICRGT